MVFILKHKCKPAFFAASLALVQNSSDGIVAGLNLKVQMKLASTNHQFEARKIFAAAKNDSQFEARKKRLAAAQVCLHHDVDCDVATRINDYINEIQNKRLQDHKDANTLISIAEHCAEKYNEIDKGIDKNGNITTRGQRRQAIIYLLADIIYNPSLTRHHPSLTSEQDEVELRRLIQNSWLSSETLDIAANSMLTLSEVASLRQDFSPQFVQPAEEDWHNRPAERTDPLKYKEEFWYSMPTMEPTMAHHTTIHHTRLLSAADIANMTISASDFSFPTVDVFFRNKLPMALLEQARILLGRAGKKKEEKVLQELLTELNDRDGDTSKQLGYDELHYTAGDSDYTRGQGSDYTRIGLHLDIYRARYLAAKSQRYQANLTARITPAKTELLDN